MTASDRLQVAGPLGLCPSQVRLMRTRLCLIRRKARPAARSDVNPYYLAQAA